MTLCIVDQCSTDGRTTKGLCDLHYRRLNRTGDVGPAGLLAPSKRPHDHCIVETCEGEYYGKGYCRPHWYIVTTYGVTPEWYDSEIAKGCAVCGRTIGKLCVDHDHDTGAVRGILCHGCNTALGLVEDDVSRLFALADYLIQQQSTEGVE